MKKTYISLFSCAGVGCYGFKMAGFECVATNELLEQRLKIQRFNNKCKYPSGYICGDATAESTHKAIFDEIKMWKQKEGLKQVDVVFATPPCQGMSTANYKKNDHEQIRNSLVVEAIKMVKAIHPKIFIFENVRAFLHSICTNITGEDILIKDCILQNLAEEYNIQYKVINFKDYGVPSSRPRTLVIGTSKKLKYTTPLHLFPTRQDEILLKDSIGHLPRLNYCEKDKKDPLHFARPFPEYMLDWIKDLKEGETAFDNPDETKPWSLDKNGNRVINKGSYMGNKYRRLIWNRPGACIATRSDVMSSQDTIHPCDNRVLSIREIMILMTIPNSFQWTDHDKLLTVENSDEYLKENECNIRRCVGEAVPTHIGHSIALKASAMLEFESVMAGKTEPEEVNNNFFVSASEAGYKNRSKKIYEDLINTPEATGNISVCIHGADDFISAAPLISSIYSYAGQVDIDIVDVSADDVKKLKTLMKCITLGSNISVNFADKSSVYYDIIIANGCTRLVNISKFNVGSQTKKNYNPDQISFL